MMSNDIMMSFQSCSKKVVPSFGRTAFVILTCWLLVISVDGSPPEDPIKCERDNSNCTITNSFGNFSDRAVCRAANVVYPSSEDELISIVANASKINRKMKVATRYSHSMPRLVCTDDDDGLLISTNNLNKIRKVDSEARTITVDSGVTLRELIEEAARADLALPYSPYWWGLTVGGMLGTGAHGSSSWGRGGTVHDHVMEIRIVSPGGPEDGYARVRTLNESDPDLDAAKLSLGVLGVISQVTFILEPLFKRSITYSIKEDDSDLEDEALVFGDEHEFGDITWYPTRHRVLYRIDDRVPSTTPGDGVYDFTGFHSQVSLALMAFRALEENQESREDAEGKCISAVVLSTFLNISAYGLTNDGSSFTGYPVVGYQNRLQASGSCLDSREDFLITVCPFDPRIDGEFYFQTAFSIGMSKVKDFIGDIKQLVSLEPKSLCVVELYTGIQMRYVKASSAYLGKDEDAIEFDITYYRSRDPLTPRLYEDILEEIEQMAMFKYDGLPHWGKNRNVAFKGAIEKYKNGTEFLRVKERFDPLGLFSSEWTDRVLGLGQGVETFAEGCALEGLCICSENSHCAPDKGYFCRPGRIYKEARVCTKNV